MEKPYKEIMGSGNIKHLVYVDGSGDDGFSFSDEKGKGSSNCFTVAMFVTKVEDVDHNIQVLNECKVLAGHQDMNNELKYTRVRRHRNAPKIMDVMSSRIKGEVVVFNAFKRRDMDSSQKDYLTTVCHSFPIEKLPEFYQDTIDSFCVVIDRMKKVEQEGLSLALDRVNSPVSKEISICYMDSKDSNTPLLQVADYFAGMMREAFEAVYDDIVVFDSLRCCEMCFRSRLLSRAAREPSRCLYKKRKLKLPRVAINNFSAVKRVLYHNKVNGYTIVNGITCIPVNYSLRFLFVDCRLK